MEIADKPTATPLSGVRGGVTFENITSNDGYGRPLFNHLKLHVPAGQHVGVLGASGAGKSTLISYILRLSDPDRGRVLIDDTPVSDATQESLRQNVSVLLQE